MHVKSVQFRFKYTEVALFIKVAFGGS